jgi:serine/threonine-protein kinase TTK/MPS1
MLPTPSARDLLAADETIINPYYMRQLLEYGIKLGLSGTAPSTEEELQRDSEVCRVMPIECGTDSF